MKRVSRLAGNHQQDCETASLGFSKDFPKRPENTLLHVSHPLKREASRALVYFRDFPDIEDSLVLLNSRSNHPPTPFKG
jgi:hypothetical protein